LELAQAFSVKGERKKYPGNPCLFPSSLACERHHPGSMIYIRKEKNTATATGF
jgi:hypothetical protein